MNFSKYFSFASFFLFVASSDVTQKKSDSKAQAAPIKKELIQDKHYDQLKKLLEQGAVDPNLPIQSRWTWSLSPPPLCYAIQTEQFKIAYLLMEQPKIDLKTKDKGGMTALLWAAYRGNLELVKFLVQQRGIDLKAKDKDGKNALLWVAYRGDMELVKQPGIDLNAKDKGGYTFLDQVYNRMGETSDRSTWKEWDDVWKEAVKRGGKFSKKAGYFYNVPDKPKQPEK